MLSRLFAPHSRRVRPVSLLYICYLGITEPLVRTQVIPYLGGLAGAGYGVVLLTFEARSLSAVEHEAFAESLCARGIEWHTLRYHNRPALPATLVDIAIGVIYAAYLISRRRISVVHARCHVPAAMALTLKQLMRVRFVFDIRGLMAEEYVDAGLWRPGGLLYRLVKRMEGYFLAHADAVVVLTRRARQSLFDIQRTPVNRHPPLEIIPCCVDLRRFELEPACVARLRTHLDLRTCPVLVYAGKFGGWYLTREMVDFFCIARRYFPDLRFLVLTQSPFAAIEQEFARRSVSRDVYHCLTVLPEEIPQYLALADFAISFRLRGISQLAASPTKIAEYLAAGLPVVYNGGIGDLDDLDGERVGVVIEAFRDSDYAQAARDMQMLLRDRTATASRCREAARRHYCLTTIGIPRYRRLYSTLLQEMRNSVAAEISDPR